MPHFETKYNIDPLIQVKMIYTYSPNWYKPQCLHLTGPSLYYASNYILYHYSLTSKSVTNELCFRSIALKHHFNYKDIKINAINSTEHHILVGINQAHLVLVSKQTLAVQQIVPLHGFESVEYIYLYSREGTDIAILCDKDGQLVKYPLGQQSPPIPLEFKVKVSPVKAIYCLQHYHFLVFTRGTILLFNQDFSHLLTHIQISHQDTIYSVDHLEEKQDHILAFLTKNKEKQSHTITIFRFKYKEEFPLQYKKKVQEIGENIQRINVNLHYPKKMADKLKNNTKACLSIKLLTPVSLMLSGKMGEVVTIRLDRVQQIVNLRPYSIQQEESYIAWPDSRHYKEVYTILEANDRIYMVSTDHNLTIWQKHPFQPKYLYSLKFLTSSVSFFFTPEHDPRTVFTLLKDANLRSFAPLEQGSHQLAEYWKCSKKYKIKKAVAHPESEGVMALGSDCNRLQIYDIYEDRLMKLFEVGQQILHISFERSQIRKQIQRLFKLEFKEHKIQYVSHFFKSMNPNIIVMLQTAKNIILISNLNKKDPRLAICPRERRLERIHHNHFWDGQLLLTSQVKQQVLNLGIKEPEKIGHHSLQIGYPQGRVLFKYDSKNRKIGVVNFKGNRFDLINIELRKEGTVINKPINVLLPSQIDYFFISHLDWRSIAYCQKQDSLVLLHLDKLEQPQCIVVNQNPYVELYRFSSKIETLCFYLQQYLIVGTKDQSIKVVDYKTLEPYQVKQKGIEMEIKPQQNFKQQKGGKMEKVECDKEEKEKQVKMQTKGSTDKLEVQKSKSL